MKISINYIHNPAIKHEEPDRIILFDSKSGKGISIEKNILKQIVAREIE